MRHYLQHVNWPVLAAIYALAAWGLWGNPRWPIAALLGLVIPAMIMLQGHQLCRIRRDLRKDGPVS